VYVAIPICDWRDAQIQGGEIDLTAIAPIRRTIRRDTGEALYLKFVTRSEVDAASITTIATVGVNHTPIQDGEVVIGIHHHPPLNISGTLAIDITAMSDIVCK
jgi:hypothetical protein